MDTSSGRFERARAARRQGRWADAMQEYRQIVALSRNAGRQRELIAGLKGLAQIERDRGKIDDALPLYLEAAKAARDFGDDLLLAHTVRHLGDVYRTSGDLQAAESCYEEALAILRSDPGAESLDLANTIRPTALLMEKLGRPQEARLLWEQARTLYAAAGVGAGVVECREAIERCS